MLKCNKISKSTFSVVLILIICGINTNNLEGFISEKKILEKKRIDKEKLLKRLKLNREIDNLAYHMSIVMSEDLNRKDPITESEKIVSGIKEYRNKEKEREDNAEKEAIKNIKRSLLYLIPGGDSMGIGLNKRNGNIEFKKEILGMSFADLWRDLRHNRGRRFRGEIDSMNRNMYGKFNSDMGKFNSDIGNNLGFSGKNGRVDWDLRNNSRFRGSGIGRLYRDGYFGIRGNPLFNNTIFKNKCTRGLGKILDPCGVW
tara:strand:+ start:2262 stop:3032 length:771 start_codon:yes stop_codon:yes gene_type:complete